MYGHSFNPLKNMFIFGSFNCDNKIRTHSIHTDGWTLFIYTVIHANYRLRRSLYIQYYLNKMLACSVLRIPHYTGHDALSNKSPTNLTVHLHRAIKLSSK